MVPCAEQAEPENDAGMHQRRVWCTRIRGGRTQYHRVSAPAVQPAAPDPPLVHTSISVRCNDERLLTSC